MKRFIVYSDTHILAPHDSGYSVDDMVNEELHPNTRPGSIVLTGDIIDRENAKKKDIPFGNGLMFRLKDLFRDRYIWGNHEGKKPSSYYYIDKESKVLFLHGHTIFWDKSKVEHWETKKLGQGKWKYRFYKFRKSFSRSKPKWLQLSDKHKAKILDLAVEHDCTTVVFGHSHRDYDMTHAGVRIINVPQGRTDLWI